MFKLDKDIRKRWLQFALVNFALVTVIFGALLAGFSAYVVTARQTETENAVRDYAQSLSSLGVAELRRLAAGQSTFIEADPSFMFALYTMRDDGSVGIAAPYVYLTENTPAPGGRTETFRTEDIDGHKFLTYTVSVGTSLGEYLKVFAPCDAMYAAREKITLYCAPFVVSFVLIAATFSLVWGYISIKPIMSGYVKQKNFINDMSHEIRTPLAVIKGNLENILAAPESSVGQVRDMLETSLKAEDYMTDISSGLLNIVRGQNKSAARKETIMSEVVSEVVDMFADMATMSNKSLIANIEYCDIPVEREKIKQLASVLMENAIKYTREGDRITVSLKNAKDGCVFSVSDTGIGVPKAELDSIFNRFYRGENAKDIPGTGLGLSIAQAVTESLGGTIKAVPNVPCGLEIIVQLKRE